MTKTARVYGGSLYDLAAEEKLDGQIMEQMIAIRQIFRENPGYLKLLGEPAIPEEERLKMIEEAFGSLPYMSIGAGVVVAIALQQIDRAPDAEASAQCHNEGLKNTNSRIKESHK